MQRIFNRHSELEKRRILRARMTIEEKILWERISNRKLKDCKFRRQYSIGPYVVDFYCPAKKLAVEIDGVIHESEINTEYDKERDDFIGSLGIKTIRISNEEIRSNLNSVINKLEGEL